MYTIPIPDSGSLLTDFRFGSEDEVQICLPAGTIGRINWVRNRNGITVYGMMFEGYFDMTGIIPVPAALIRVINFV